MKNIEAALKWIVGILNNNKIPFQVDGGLAAKLYGSNRNLADIDIIVPNKDVFLIMPIVKEYIKFGPGRFKDDNWDLFLMTLEYMGQTIDISGSEDAKIFNKKTNEWVITKTDFSHPEVKELFDIHLPFVPKEKLIQEKSKLARPVDIEDIKEMD